MQSAKEFETMSPEWQQDFMELAELYKGLKADQKKQILRELTKIRLDEMINKGLEIVDDTAVEDLTLEKLDALKELSGADGTAFVYNAFLIGLVIGYEEAERASAAVSGAGNTTGGSNSHE